MCGTLKDAGIGRDEFLAILDSAAEASGEKLILCIDAVNETVPDRRRWRAWYPVISQQISRSHGLKLLVSCRDSYLGECLPEWADLPNVEHNGFLGREFEVVPRFFEHYRLTLPSSPLLQSEFGNPLFLHIVCQSLAEYGLTTIPEGGGGFSSIVNEFLMARNQVVAENLGYHAGEPNVQTAINGLARKMNEQGSQRLSVEVARDTVSEGCQPPELAGRLFDALEKESLISIVPEGSPAFGQTPGYRVRFSLERMTDHLRAVSYLSDIPTSEVAGLFSTGGSLSFTVCDSDAVGEHRGLLEALAILIPERHGLELPAAVDQSETKAELDDLVLNTLQWRDPESLSESTTEKIGQAFRSPRRNKIAVDALLSLCTRPAHKLNARYLHRLLSADPIELRDAYWPLALHELYEAGGVPKRLLDWTLHSNLQHLEDDAARLLSIALSWFFAAADRRVRDKATKALVRLATSKPQVLSQVLNEFADCDDDYVRERVLVAIYGAMLVLGNRELAGEISCSVWQEFFETSESTPEHASIRDHARLILELSADLDALPPGADLQAIRPPYQSEWPVDLPDADLIAPYLKDRDRFPWAMNLDEGIGSDFARYHVDTKILNRFEHDGGILDRGGVLRWFLLSAANMGYPCELDGAAYYDFLMLHTYGGGRARQGWAERIGKKYYWVLINRLMGRVSDHLRRKLEWGELVETAEPAIQALDLRDIDPTDLRAYRNQDYGLGDGNWFLGSEYRFSDVDSSDQAQWVLRSDLIDPLEALAVRAPSDGSEWIVLSSHYDWNDRDSDDSNSDQPYCRVGRGIWAYFADNQHLERLEEELRQRNYQARVTNLLPGDYRGYLGEFPRTLTYRQRFEEGDILSETEVCGISTTPAAFEHRKGSEWEYDYGQDRADSKSLLVPAPVLIHRLLLTWDGDSGWTAPDGNLVAVTLRTDDDRSVLLVSKSNLCDYLKTADKTLVWSIVQEKFGNCSGHN